MNRTSEAEFTEFLARSGISLSPYNIGTGSQLSSDRHHHQIVTIRFQEDGPEENQKDVLNALFKLDSNWFVFPRYGRVSDLLEMPEITTSPAATVSTDSIDNLVSSMVLIQGNLKVIEYDPYFISGSGEILATWDHHVFSNGFRVKFASIPLSTLFITALNKIGAKYNVFTANA